MNSADPAKPTEPSPGPRRADFRGRLVLRRFVRRRLAVLSLFLVLLFFAFAYIDPVFYKWQYNQLDYQAFLQPPTLQHWFSTTQNGFDMLTLTMKSMQKSLIIGLIGAVISTNIT